jgi:hypothetical protein
MPGTRAASSMKQPSSLQHTNMAAQQRVRGSLQEARTASLMRCFLQKQHRQG